jgi:hypothetical protein
MPLGKPEPEPADEVAAGAEDAVVGATYEEAAEVVVGAT